MKNRASLPILIVLGCFACNFSNQEKNPSTGLSIESDGLSYEKAYLVGPDNTPKNTNQVNLGSNTSIVIEGIENYEPEGGRVFPGLMLTVTDKEGITVINEADLLNNEKGYQLSDAATVSGIIKVGEPMKSAQTYHVKMIVWDKNKPYNKLTAEIDLIVQ